jgi:hypothetical protein
VPIVNTYDEDYLDGLGWWPARKKVAPFAIRVINFDQALAVLGLSSN